MKKIISIFLIVFSILKVASQTLESIKHQALAEKIYLQLDSNVYTSDKTIWFKAVLANAVSHNLKITSGVLYVDLISYDNEIIESKMLKINNGIGRGYFDLNRSYKDGRYLIRAYTEWNKNFKNDFIAEKYISVFSNDLKDQDESEKKIKKKINKGDEIEEKLEVGIKFFPEGGKIIKNLPIKIGFKITDNNGSGIILKGDVINNKNEVLTSFRSNEVGLGFFEIEAPNEGQNLRARISNSDGETFTYFNLPKIYEIGYTLSVIERKDILIAGVRTNIISNQINQSVNLKVSVRGKVYFKEKAILNDGKYIFTIPKLELPDGVVIFQLSNHKGQTISERLYFNQLSERGINVTADLSKKEYNKRESIELNLSLENSQFIDGKINISSSILVLNKSLFGSIQNERENLLSYFLLSSDIKGKIEKPGKYFLKNDSLDIDYLMLTQGWSNYKYVSPREKLNYKLENGLRIKGVINVNKRLSKKENLDIIMTTLGDDNSIYTGNVLVPGCFDFQIRDYFGDEKKMIFKPSGLDDKESKNYKITLSELKRIKPNFKPSRSNKRIFKDSTISSIITKNRFQSKERNNYFMSFNSVTKLDEVVIDAYKMTPKRKEIFEKYGKPDVVIDGKEIQKQTNNYTTGLYSNLVAFRDKVYTERDRRGNYSAKTTNGGKGHVNLVVVDGIPVSKDNYLLVQKIVPNEVTSFEIIDNPARARQLYASVYGRYPYGEFQASIIAIYTKLGKGLFGALDLKDGDKIYTIPVFSGEKEFYIPNHDDTFPNVNSEPDLRSTIYWKPNFQLNSQKHNKIKFSHSDDTGDFVVIIEAITEDGRIDCETVEYSVVDFDN